MRQASGFITEDGTFFETEEEAKLHEAEQWLRGQMVMHFPQIDVDGILNLVETLRTELGEYLNATAAHLRTQTKKQNRTGDQDSSSSEVSGHLGHVSSAKEDLEALLQLPSRRPSHVPDVGSGPRTEKVQERREEHGPGVRGTDAPSVRSGEDMAVEPSAKAGRTRPDSRKKDIHK